MLRAHGSKKKYFNELVGYNSRLDALQAAILRAKLPHVEEWNAGRRAAAARYRDLLGDLSGVALPVERSGVQHVYHQFTIRVRGTNRDRVRSSLTERGIGTMVYYPKPVHRLPIYAGIGNYPEADVASAEVLSLPIWPRITLDTQERVAESLSAVLPVC
jgi:dTDP-4-amino-4,6-dideoxygalactose transaminase